MSLKSIVRTLLPPSPRIRYTRKSTEQADRQMLSHEQQNDVMDRLWGPLLDASLWFRDSHTGTTFDRPGYNSLKQFCEQHPQPLEVPGIIDIYDPSRFGRPLTSQGKADIMAFLFQKHFFDSLGWQIRFTNVQLIGDAFADAVTMVTHAYMASAYSAELKKKVALGKHTHAQSGRWIHGIAPYPARRYDDLKKCYLEDGELAQASRQGTVLKVPLTDRKNWEDAGRMYLAGHSLQAIGSEMFRRGLKTRKNKAWGHAQIRNMLTNKALVGLIEYNHTMDGKSVKLLISAAWGNLVDRDLFDAVQREVERRSSDSRNRQRRERQQYILAPRCAHCGIAYHGSVLNEERYDRARVYRHPMPRPDQDPEQYEVTKVAGCRNWTIRADEFESVMKDLIVSQRGTSEFEDAMRESILKKSGLQSATAERAALLATELSKVETRYAAAVEAELEARMEGRDAGMYKSRVDQLHQEVEFHRKEFEDAKRKAERPADSWTRVRRAIRETRNIGAIWPHLGLGERKFIFDEWIYELLVLVDPVPGYPKKNTKRALAFIKTSDVALELSLEGVPAKPQAGGDSPFLEISTSASESSSVTHPSDSTASRPSSAAWQAATASGGDPGSAAIRPSAQAAWPRTNGSSSCSAATSGGTASGLPQFPSATATFRRSPRRFARLTGEFLKRLENSSCVSAINSTSLAPCTPALGQNASSEVIWTNLDLLYGQTSWQMSHP